TATFDTFTGNTVSNGDHSAGSGSDVYVLSDGNTGSGFSGGSPTATNRNCIPGQAVAPVPRFSPHPINGAAGPALGGSNHNFVSNNSAAGPLPSGAVINASTVTDPLLSGLATGNGGPTPTMALLTGSPAVNQGANNTGIT